MKIELKDWLLDDSDSLINICNKIERKFLSNRIPNPYTKDSANWWLNMVSETNDKTAIYRKIVVDNETVGTISIEQKEDVYHKDAEIGYFIIPEQYGKGIMTEAVNKICKIAFDELDIIRITGLVYEPNIASRRVLEKNSFVLEGIMKDAIIKNDNIYNLCVYAKYR